MPKTLKKYLNRNYVQVEEDKRETSELINYLGEFLSEKIGLTAQAARGLIKLAIKD
ncbi:MAG: hypothetical protein JW891_05735 [Candidatus Lokiarchaeota archaeon]|nr:hypothetical protein [Candidatus Lokiarchaeota archaeon]